MRAGLLGALCIALTSGLTPWIDAVSGAFIPADIAQDAAAARLFVAGVNPYGPVIREAHAALLDVPVAGTFPHFPHPPFSLLVSFPLAFVPFEVGAGLWFGFTLALIVLFAALLAGEAAPGTASATWRTTLLLLLWPPVLYNLEKGQWSILLAVLLAAGWRALSRGHSRAGAAWLGAAAAVKVFPVVIGAYLVLRSVRLAAWFGGVGVVLTAVPLVWIGVDAFPAFIAESRSNMPYWESFPSVMFSIHGALSRLLVGGQWAEPWTHAPLAARVIEAVVVAGLLGTAVWMSLQARRSRIDEAVAFAGWVVLLPMLNPQSLGHNGVLVALPLVLLARTLERSSAAWQRWTWAAALVLVSLPKQTVWALAPPPVGPIEGLAIVALPTWGSLLLFAVCASVACRQVREARRVQPGDGSGKILPSPPGAPDAAAAQPEVHAHAQGSRMTSHV